MKLALLMLKDFITDKRVIAIALLALTIGGLYLFFARRSASHFQQEYEAYATLAAAQETAAYVPAAPDNPIRQDLNGTLSQALQSNTPVSKRLADAQHGLALVKELDTEIDAIGKASDAANTQIAKMQESALSDFSTSGATDELISLAKERSSVIEDIRGLSYRADFDTAKIFNRIIADKGALTAAHVVDLNDEIPEVETEFDQRSDLYAQLSSLSGQIDQKAEALLGPSFTPAPTPDLSGASSQ